MWTFFGDWTVLKYAWDRSRKGGRRSHCQCVLIYSPRQWLSSAPHLTHSDPRRQSLGLPFYRGLSGGPGELARITMTSKWQSQISNPGFWLSILMLVAWSCTLRLSQMCIIWKWRWVAGWKGLVQDERKGFKCRLCSKGLNLLLDS
jgi:hypothetical protein